MKKKALSFILAAVFLAGCSTTEKSSVVTESQSSQKEQTPAAQQSVDKNHETDDENDKPDFSPVFLDELHTGNSVNYISEVNDSFYISGYTPSRLLHRYTTYDPETNTGTFLDSVNEKQNNSMSLSNDTFYCVYDTDEYLCNIQEIDMEGNVTADIEANSVYISFIYSSDSSVYYADGMKSLKKYDKKTKTLSSFELTEPESHLIGINCCTDDQENVYIFCEDEHNIKKLVKTDPELNMVFTNENYNDMDGYISSVFMSLSGEPVLAVLSEEALYINVINPDNGDTTRRCEIYDAALYYTGHSEYDLIYQSVADGAYYGYSIKDDSSVFLCESFCNDGESIIGITSDNTFMTRTQEYTPSESVTLICDKTGAVTDKITHETERYGRIKASFSDKKGNIYYSEECFDPILINQDDTEVSDSHMIHRISADGKHTSFEIPVFNSMYYSRFLSADENGNILIAEEDDSTLLLSSYTPDGKLNAKLTLDDWISFGSVAFSDNKTCLLYSAPNETTKYIVLEQKPGSIEIIDTVENPGFSYIFSGNDSFDIFMLSENSIMGYSFDTDETVKTADLLANGLLSARLIFSLGEDFIAFSDNNCRIIKNGTAEDRTIIRLGGVSVGTSVLEHIIDFNQTNEKYYIECTSYADNPESKEKLNLDIATGKLDFLTFHSYYNQSSYDYNKDIFANLYEYIDNDPEINRSDFF